MFPTDFDESNCIVDKPNDLSRDECEPLNVCVAESSIGPVIISCFKPTMEELEEITKTGRVWIYHWGNQLQPHAVSGHFPFHTEENNGT